MTPASARPTSPGGEPRDEAERLARLIEVSRSLNSKLDLPSIIRQILQAALHVIPAADSGTLYIYEPERDQLVVYDAIGLGPEMYDIAVRPGRGLTGRAFAAQMGCLYADEAAVMDHMSDGGDENLSRYARATRGLSPPKSAMTAPMLYKGTTVGVLIVDNMRESGVFEAFDLRLLDSLAQTAALAIANARLFEAEREARGRLEVANRELVSQREQLQRQLTVRSLLSETARGEFSTGTIATRVADLCGGRVWILDAFYHVVASEPRVSGRAVHRLPEPVRELVLEGLRAATRTRTMRHIPIGDGGHLLVAPVCSGREVDGFVLIELTSRHPDSVDETAIDSASLLVAMHQLRDRIEKESEERNRGYLLRQVLESGRSVTGLKPLRPPLCLVVGQVSGARGPAVFDEQDDRTFQQVQALVRKVEPRAIVTAFQGHLVLLLSGVEGRAAGPVAGSVTVLQRRLQDVDPGWETTFAICEPVDELQLLSAAFHEGRLAIAARRQLGLAPRVFAVGSLRAYRLLLRSVSDDDVLELCMQTLARVREHEAENGALLSTYRTYLAQGSSLKATARMLGVHPHTVQYRLERLQVLSGLSLRRFEERLTLELATRILELAGE